MGEALNESLLINLSYHLFIYSLSRHNVLGAVLGSKNSVVHETVKVPYSSGAYLLVVEAGS